MTLSAQLRQKTSLFAVMCATALVAAACSSQSPDAQQAGELLFPAGQPTPTVVEPADPVDEANLDGADGTLPEQLAFADWTVNDLVDRLSTATNNPITVRFNGNGEETLELADDQWRVVGPPRTPSSDTNITFTTRGSGDNEWVTYEHVVSGTFASHAFAAATLNLEVSELLEDEEATAELATQKLLLDRAIATETTDLNTTWVPYERSDNSFFTATLLTPELVADVLASAAAAVADADVDGELVTTSNENSLEAEAPNTEFTSVVVEQDQTVTITSTGGWSMTIENGVADPSLLGEPGQPNVLTRELLLTATSVPAGCITPVIEARSIVENGFTSCNDADEIANILSELPDLTEEEFGPTE